MAPPRLGIRKLSENQMTEGTSSTFRGLIKSEGLTYLLFTIKEKQPGKQQADFPTFHFRKASFGIGVQTVEKKFFSSSTSSPSPEVCKHGFLSLKQDAV